MPGHSAVAVGGAAAASRPAGGPVSRRSLLGSLLRGWAAGVGLAFVLEAGRVLVGPNFHTVIPGAVYRCSQPSAGQVEALVKSHGVRTVVNLRGCCDPIPWYLDEARATGRLDVSEEDLSFSAGRLPSVPVVRELVEVIDHSEYPIVFHCHRGIDRTGMASTVALLLLTDTPLPEARRQLGPRFAHLPLGRTGNIDRFFDLYEEWLAARGETHSREAFRHWITREYAAGERQCRVELLDPRGDPVRVARGKPSVLRVRCTNTSDRPWPLRPGPSAGVHAFYVLTDASGRLRHEGRAGLFEGEVPPGRGIDLTLALPSLPGPARYRLRVDMEDGEYSSFFQTGSEPLFVTVEVP
jgi:hypothetical protein